MAADFLTKRETSCENIKRGRVRERQIGREERGRMARILLLSIQFFLKLSQINL